MKLLLCINEFLYCSLLYCCTSPRVTWSHNRGGCKAPLELPQSSHPNEAVPSTPDVVSPWQSRGAEHLPALLPHSVHAPQRPIGLRVHQETLLARGQPLAIKTLRFFSAELLSSSPFPACRLCDCSSTGAGPCTAYVEPQQVPLHPTRCLPRSH